MTDSYVLAPLWHGSPFRACTFALDILGRLNPKINYTPMNFYSAVSFGCEGNASLTNETFDVCRRVIDGDWRGDPHNAPQVKLHVQTYDEGVELLHKARLRALREWLAGNPSWHDVATQAMEEIRENPHKLNSERLLDYADARNVREMIR